jgi:hypothetical protein
VAKVIRDVRSLARTHTETAMRTLVQIAASKQAPEASRVAAATALLDRGWGKAKQEVEINQEVTFNLAESLARIARLSEEEIRDITPKALSKQDSVVIENIVEDQSVGNEAEVIEPVHASESAPAGSRKTPRTPRTKTGVE